MAQIGVRDDVAPSLPEARRRPPSGRAAERDRTVLRGIARIFEAALTSETEEDLGRRILEVAEAGTSSTIGFMGELDAIGRLGHVATSSPAWAACGLGSDQVAGPGVAQARVAALCHRVLADGRTVLDNRAADGRVDPSADDGFESFLGAPLLQNGLTIGLVAVANKPGGYNRGDAEALEALSPAVVEAYAHRRAEEELRESQAKFKGFYDNAPLLMGLCEMDGDEIIPIDVNPAARRFFGPPIAAAHHWAPSERPEPSGNMKLWQDSYRRCRDTGKPVQFELEHLSPNGDRWLEATITHLGPARNGRLLLGFVAEDITARRLRDDARDAFTGVLAHELRTPITSILAGGELLSSGRLHSDAAADVARDVADEARRLARLVENLLVVSRVERRIDLERHEPVPLHHLVSRVINQAAGQWPDHCIESELAPELPVAAGDDGYVTQILRNLVSNAVRYGRGKVTVSAEPAAEGVEIRVADDGPGIAAGDEERVFDLFHRGRSATGPAAGAGMGLFVCRALVEAMNGRVRTGRSALGGAEFAFWLPTYRVTPA